MKESEIIRQAARELCGFIDKANMELERNISPTDESPPDYHDHQACHDLELIANKLDATHPVISGNAKTIKINGDEGSYLSLKYTKTLTDTNREGAVIFLQGETERFSMGFFENSSLGELRNFLGALPPSDNKEKLKMEIEELISLHCDENGRHESGTNAFVFDSAEGESYAEGLQAALDLFIAMGES